MRDEQSQTPAGAGSRTPTGGRDGRMVCVACTTEYPADMRFCPIDGSVLRPLSPAGDELVGSVIDGRYQLLEKIGQGGMGDVYLGEHVRTRRRCAVKVVSRAQARDPVAFGRFLREATNAGRINHPHVATVYDFGETDDGIPYLAMEYVEGEPLSLLLEREGALAAPRAVEIARQVAEAVAAAHDLGIVHRDLKPSNILITQDRRGADVVKVVDFGIARSPDDEHQNLTRTGVMVGTPEYMSPEQLMGEALDGRSDIYSLGCVLYQMLTGAPAFEGPTAQVISRRLTEPPPHARGADPGIPRALDDVIVKALGRTPAERFQTMETMRDALLGVPLRNATTTRRRLAAWLGFGSSRQQPAPVTGTRTKEPAVADPPTGITRADAPADETRSRTVERPQSVPVTSARGAGEDDVARELVEAPETVTLAGAEAVPVEAAAIGSGAPRRAGRYAVAAGVVVLLVFGIAVLRGDGGGRSGDEVPEVASEPQPAPVPTAPDAAQVAALRAELAAAEQEAVRFDYLGALDRLRLAEVQLAELVARFPTAAELQGLADSARTQLQATHLRCTSLRRVALDRNETPPECGSTERMP